MKMQDVAVLDCRWMGHNFDEADECYRPLWVLLVSVGMGRQRFAHPIYGQKLADVVEGLDAAWNYFGSVPDRLVIGRFPVSVARRKPPQDSRLTHGFLEYALERGFEPELQECRPQLPG